MNTIFSLKLRTCLFTAIFGAWQLSAHALPKAAENEDAPVVITADVAKPKATSKPAKKEVKKTTPPAAKAKPRNPSAAPKKTKKTTTQ